MSKRSQPEFLEPAVFAASEVTRQREDHRFLPISNLSGFREALVANGHDNFNFTVGMSLPIWRDKLRAGVREAEQSTAESARRYDATRDDTFRQIRRLIAQADAYEEQMRLFRENILPRSEQTFRVSQADYRVGRVDFLQVIDNYAEWLMFRIQLARLESNLGQALASLERVVGCQLANSPPPRPDLETANSLTPNPKTSSSNATKRSPAEWVREWRATPSPLSHWG